MEELEKEKAGSKPVSYGEGQALAQKIKACGYYETSAKTGEGVTEAFQAAIDAVEKQDNPVPDCSSCVLLWWWDIVVKVLEYV